MTLVLARRFGQRIVVLSDTMISDRQSVTDNIFPGRLKSIVINKWLTVSYAGLSVQAMDVARSLKSASVLTTSTAVSALLEANQLHEGEIDFILCSHEAGARLIKISDGSVFEGAEFYWIGNANAALDFSGFRMEHPVATNLPDYFTQEESNFQSAFWHFLKEGVRHGVGGAAINCLCSEYGHCYQSHAGVFSWDTIVIGRDDPTAREQLNKTGMYTFGYNVCSPPTRGQAVLGLYFDQSRTGYLYQPLRADEATKVPNTSVSDFSEMVAHAAAAHVAGASGED